MTWPAHGATVRLASRHIGRIRSAIIDSVDVDAIAQAWLETHPVDDSKPTPKQARDWAQIHGHVDTKPLDAAIRLIYADGYALGRRAGLYMLGHAIGLKKADSPAWIGDSRAAMVTDWSTWKPGNEAARALVDKPGSLERLMNGRMVLSRDIASTTLDRIGTVLAQSLSAGTRPTARDLAGYLDSVVDDPQRALVIAETEMARSVSVASRDLYEDSGVEQVEWLVAEGCEDCQDNADASPINIDDTFPSGDAEPPAHPNCLCSLAPYIVDTLGRVSDTGEDIDTENVSGGGDLPNTTDDLADALSPGLRTFARDLTSMAQEDIYDAINNDTFRDFTEQMIGHEKENIANVARAINQYTGDSNVNALAENKLVMELLEKGNISIPDEGLYRGINVASDKFELISQLKTGDVFPLLGPRSFSVVDDVAQGFAERGEGNAIMIHLTEGTGLPVYPLSDYATEGEWLVANNLVITDIESTGTYEMTITVKAVT